MKQESFDVIRNINSRYFQIIDILICFQVIEIYGNEADLYNKIIAEFDYLSEKERVLALRKADAFLNEIDFSLAA